MKKLITVCIILFVLIGIGVTMLVNITTEVTSKSSNNLNVSSIYQIQLDSLDKLIQDKETKLAMLNKVLHFKHLELMDYCPETHYKIKNTK